MRLLPFFLFLPALALAQVPSPADRDIIRDKQQRLLEDQQRRLEEIKNLPGQSVQTPDTAQPGEGGCVNVQTIQIQGANSLKESTQRELVAPFEGQCLDTGKLNDLLGVITKHYLARGLITSRAYLPPQDLASGKLIVLVIEGKLEGFGNTQADTPTAREIWMSYPGREGNVLNLRELEQMVDQFARLPSKAATLDILPGSEPGLSKIQVKAEAQKSWRAGLRFHNLGTKGTGERQAGASLVWDSPLGLADQISLYGARDIGEHHGKHSDNESANYNIPFGWWTFNLGYNRSYYNSWNDLSGFELHTRGKSEISTFRADRLLHRNDISKTSAAATLTHSTARNYIEDIYLETSSYKLTEFEFSINHGRRVASTFVNAEIGWQHGIGWPDTQSRGHPKGSMPDARYNKYTLTLSALRPFELFNQNFSFESLAFGQKSEQALFSPQRLGLGGIGSVRAFKDQTLYGNSGGYWRNQVRWRKGIETAALKRVINSVSVALGYDIGAIQGRKGRGDDSAQLSGTAVELALSGPVFSASLTAARSMDRPTGVKREHPVYFNLSVTY